jgi:septum formation protein
MKKFILASASPARKELLRRAGFRFDVIPSRARERMRRTLRDSVLTNAARKAAAVARRHPGRWVLAADTLIEFRGRLYGKPRSAAEATALLSRMAGRTHKLATGVALQLDARRIRRVAITWVTMRAQPRERIAEVVGLSRATRLAGGYAIRPGRDPLVERLRGSFSNVVGLPMEIVGPLLRRALRARRAP